MSADKPIGHDEIQGDILHEYDGILEADNHLPMWWLWTFFGAIGFSVVYWMLNHGWETSASPMERYTAELEAASQGSVSEELLSSLTQDPAALAEGKSLFVTNCAVCHQENGAGKIGPNLTDEYWIHGSDAISIHKTIDQGILNKGMPAWGATLGPKAVQRVTAYTISLKGKNLPGKEPQGVKAGTIANPNTEEDPAGHNGLGQPEALEAPSEDSVEEPATSRSEGRTKADLTSSRIKV